MRLFTPTGVSIEVSDELGAALLGKNSGYKSREVAPAKEATAPTPAAIPRKPRARKADND